MHEVADTPYGRMSFALAEADWAVYTQTLFRVLLARDPAEAAVFDQFAKAAAGWETPLSAFST